MQVDNVLGEAADRLADALILFCQGLGLLPTVLRKVSRSLSLASEESGSVASGDSGPGRKGSITRLLSTTRLLDPYYKLQENLHGAIRHSEPAATLPLHPQHLNCNSSLSRA